jgi:3-oxoadipate enol-lactonase
MPEIECDFGRMYFRVRGEGRQTIVFLHDYFGTHQSWNAQQLQLSRYAQVIAPDLRGHGRSVLERGELSISAMAGDIVMLLDQMEVEQVHLVGCSHGAVVAMHMARSFPDRVASIVVTSVPDLNDPSVIEYGRKYVSSVYPGLEADLSRIHGDGTGEYLREVLLKRFENSLDDPPIDHRDALRLAPEIQCPALVLGGDSDPVMSPEKAIELMRQIQSAKVCILPNTGHLAHQEAPGLYADTVLDQLLRTAN